MGRPGGEALSGFAKPRHSCGHLTGKVEEKRTENELELVNGNLGNLYKPTQTCFSVLQGVYRQC